jgi:acylpyruvate hydrolase
MKFISFEADRGVGTGIVHPADPTLFTRVETLDAEAPASLMALIAQGPAAVGRLGQRASEAAERGQAGWEALNSVRLLPVIAQPPKIVCVGLNYAEHAKEGGNARPEYPSFFMRGATSLIAHEAALIRPPMSDKLDFEAELAVVIGQRVHRATVDNALDAVAGYACFNDGTLRDYQRKTAQWTIGKNFDGTGAFGPWLVTPDELPAGARGLSIVSRLNGKVMQSSTTADMLWSVAELIAIISECMTLEPGDVIATGTPSGVGYARTPPVFMRDGDVIEIEIEGIGCLRNPVRDEAIA